MSISPYINHNVQELVAYQPGKPISETARELGLDPAQIVKLASNENSQGPSPMAVRAMQEAAAGMHIYPDGASYDLRSKIAARHGVEFCQTVVGNGSSELIELLCHACLRPGLELVAAQYSFAMYALMSKLFDAKYVEVPNKADWSHDLQGMLAAITPQTRLVFITNPTNPVGTMVGQAEMDAFMAAVPEHVIVAFDEAYIEFAGEVVDCLKYVKAGRNVVALRTFSKAYGLAGARVGYAVTTPEIADLLNKARSPFNVNLMAQVAACAALDDPEHLASSVEMVKQGREQYYAAFQAWGIPYIPSHGNFILVQVGNGKAVYDEMLARGVILRPMGGYGLPEYVRITVGNQSENEQCLAALQAVLKK
ncbi:MAG: histidinol-phosphate transaminase [Akkermansia sp.]|nr:histidinol-phosphate transaminase [Akkermansia sp.]